ncbi:MAG: HIT domain-containing protein [Calditrichaceae bacterium]
MKRLWAPWRMEYILNEIDKSPEGCIFCDLPPQKDDRKNLIVYRAEKCFVMLNKFPYNNGHLMVVPYLHTGNILDLDDDIMLDLQKVIQMAVKVLENEMSPHAMNIGMNLGRVAGAGIVDHLHYHIVPRWDGDTNFMPVISDTKVISESLTVSRDKLHNGFKKISDQ